MEPLVSVTIVTHNSAGHLEPCLESLLTQDYPALEVVVVDNCSGDRTGDILRAHSEHLHVVWNRENTGFCGGQNQAIALSRGEWVLVLNPDVVLEPGFITQLLSSIDRQADPAVGIACGRLSSTVEKDGARLLDSTGVYFTPQLRHFDRDCRQPDRGQHLATEYVFGATGAAALYRRTMIESISLPSDSGAEFFDQDFFAYREDADVAWRAQLLGWNCLYVPQARGSHVRTCLPDNRAQMSPAVNMHSVKNRFLMRIKNIGAALYSRNLLAITFRDLCAVAYCLFVERTSLPGLWFVIREFPRHWAKRKWIQSRRKRSDRQLAPWFAGLPGEARLVENIAPAAASATLGGRT